MSILRPRTLAIALLVVVALLGSACTQAQSEAAPAPSVEAGAEDISIEEIGVEEIALPTGREALEAAQGQPHVLWFWGAH